MAAEADDIIRYRKGEMTPAEMHAFEKKVASDPFLQDALEGAEDVSPAQLESDVRELESRIGSRTSPNRLYYWSLRAAAAITVIAVATFVIWNQSTPDDLPAIAEKANPETSPQPEPLIALGEEKKPTDNTAGPSPQPSASGGVKETKDESAKATLPEEPEKQDIDQFADLILAEEEAIEGQPAQTGVKTEKSDITAGKVFLHTDTLAKQAEPLGRAAPTEDLDKASRARKSEAVSAVFGGRVIDESGAPLPGANILAGDRVGTIADTEGRFQLTLPPGENTVTVSFIGMEPRVVHLTEQGADIVLKDNGQEISEMAVVSYSRSADPPTYRATVTMPEPVGGRRSFNGYLAREVRYPQEARDKKISGRVVIDFTVDAGGAPVDFTIVRGIGAGCDEELIRLIREGPAWLPAAQNGKVIPATVRVRFRFDLP